jgi:hypothetical protein
MAIKEVRPADKRDGGKTERLALLERQRREMALALVFYANNPSFSVGTCLCTQSNNFKS